MVISIHAAYFSVDADYQSGRQYLLFLIGTDENTEPVEIRMSVGADWASADGGVTITHPTKRKQTINASCIYGHWISHAQEIPELVNVLRGRGNPTNAKVWEGLILHLQESEIKFGRNIDPQMRLMPTEYFGLIEDSTPANIPFVPPAPVVTPPLGAPQVPTPVPAPAMDPAALIAQARAKANQGPTSTGNSLYDKYFTLAKETEWGVFLATALADSEVLADDELAQQIVDQSQLYTQARA